MTNCRTVSFNGINNDCYVCVTKPGFIPYIARVGGNVYLQNENIEMDMNILGGSVYAGNNVIADRQEGPVVVKTGNNINIRYSGEVVLDNGFEVEEGAIFQLKKHN